MPRYYFDVDIQDVSSVSDTEGMELQSLAEAKAEALSAISGMAQRFVPSVPEMSITPLRNARSVGSDELTRSYQGELTDP
jgi:hypothetical protein